MKTPLLILASLLLPLTIPSSSAQRIVAHRGASGSAPENTLAAFRQAWSEGADAIEGDFYLSADGEIVCIHDQDTKRTCPDAPNCLVAKTKCADLRALDVGAWKHADFTGERIPTLDEVLDVVPAGKRIFIEIKCGPEMVPILKAKLAARQNPESSQIAIICFDEKVIAACRKALPEIDAHWLVSFKQNKITGAWSPKLETVLATLKNVGASGLDVQAEPAVVDKAFVERIRAAGFALHCWTINDPTQARVFQDLGVDSITTDQPALVRRELGL